MALDLCLWGYSSWNAMDCEFNSLWYWWPRNELQQKNRLKREQEIKREQKIRRKELCKEESMRMQELRLRLRLDDGTKRNQGKRKFQQILKKRLHRLEHEFEEIQESKRTIKWSEWFFIFIYEQKLQELDCRQQEILFRAAYLDGLLVWLLVLCAVHVEDASHQGGGFRNLILDGWWLEFWEIVLLAAGDVESNPGPRQITDEELIQISDTPIGK